LAHYVKARQQSEQLQAKMLYTHAALCRMAMDGKMPPVWEAFPLWTPEEINQFRTEKIKSSLMKHTKKGGG
jgi:hypothetical protein